jgi:hypothetical protein
LNATVVKEGVYQLLVQIWLKVMVFLTATRFNLCLVWWPSNITFGASPMYAAVNIAY